MNSLAKYFQKIVRPVMETSYIEIRKQRLLRSDLYSGSFPWY